MLSRMTALAQAIATTRVRLLGGVVDPITPGEMLAATEAFVAGGGTAVIANHNSHSLFLLARTPALRAFFDDADLVQIDSKPMILWGRLMGLPVGREHRSTYLDWRDDFWATVRDRGWRVFHVGGAPGVGERAAAEIRKAFPGVQLAEHCGYFDIDPASADSVALRRDIAAFDPDIILVGMGMPRQEQWIAANRDLIGRGVLPGRRRLRLRGRRAGSGPALDRQGRAGVAVPSAVAAPPAGLPLSGRALVPGPGRLRGYRGAAGAAVAVPYVFSRQPVRKIHQTAARHTARKPAVAARLTPTLTSDTPKKAQRKPLTR